MNISGMRAKQRETLRPRRQIRGASGGENQIADAEVSYPRFPGLAAPVAFARACARLEKELRTSLR